MERQKVWVSQRIDRTEGLLTKAIEGVQCDQFTLIRMFQATEAFLDLLVSDPPLAFFVAGQFGQGEFLEEAVSLVSRKQAEVAERLGFPGTPATAKTLRKVVPESVIRESAQQLRDALRAGRGRAEQACAPSPDQRQRADRWDEPKSLHDGYRSGGGVLLIPSTLDRQLGTATVVSPCCGIRVQT